MSLDARLAAAQDREREAQAELRANAELAAQRPALVQAEEQITADRAQITATRETLETRKRELRQGADAVQEHFATLAARRDALNDQLAQDLAAIDAELAALPPPGDTSAVTSAVAAVTAADRMLQAAEQATAAKNTAIGTISERLRATQEAIDALVPDRIEAERLEGDIAQWTLLAKALGPDGIIALTIDDAGPAIAGIANDLLLRCYGPRFSPSRYAPRPRPNPETCARVSMWWYSTPSARTRRACAPCLEASASGSTRRSPGRWRYTDPRSAVRGQDTLFTDETDGALDAGRKRMFLQMKRAVLEVGGYRREYFISHSPELWEMADATIRLAELD